MRIDLGSVLKAGAVIAGMTGLVACSGGAGSNSSPATQKDAINAALGEMQKTMTDGLGVGDAISPSILNLSLKPLAVSPWEDPSVKVASKPDHMSQVTLPQFLNESLTPGLVRANGSAVNVFGRLEGALSQLCIVGKITNGVPSGGTITVNFEDAAVMAKFAECGMTDLPTGHDEQPMTSTNLTIVAQAPGSAYEWQVVLEDLSSYFLTINGDVMKVLSTEDYVRTDGGKTINYFSRTIVSFDRSTKDILASYQSNGYYNAGAVDGTPGDLHPDAHQTYYRIAIDGATKASKFFDVGRMNEDGHEDIVMAVETSGNAASDIFAILDKVDLSNSTPAIVAEKACVTPVTWVASSTGASTCGTITSTVDMSTLKGTVIVAKNKAGMEAMSTKDSAIGFTKSTIFTVAE